MYHTKEIHKVLTENIDTIIIYTFGDLYDEDGQLYKDVYVHEFKGYIERIVGCFEELIQNNQFYLSIDKIVFLLEYEMMFITCDPHPHKNYNDIEELSATLLLKFVDKFNKV